MRYPVLLHGFTGSSAAWGDRIVDGLASAGRAPVLVDLPGHGHLGGEREPELFSLDAVLDVIDGAGDWPEDLVGYSMGGRIALHYAVRRPGRVRRLVLESCSPGLASPRERQERCEADERLAARIEEAGLEAFVEEWERLPLFESQAALDASVLARQRERRMSNDPSGLAEALRGLGTGALPSLWESLPDVKIPTLIMAGGLDTKFVELGGRMAAALPHGRLVVVPDVGHCVHLERPEAWLEAVAAFLADTRPS